MRKPGGDWLRPTLQFERHAAALPKALRAQAYRDEERRRELSYQTLRRQVTAATYARSVAKSEGLDLDDVRAAVVCVEALMRLEKRDSRLAAELRGPVLRGETSQRALLDMLKPAAVTPSPTEGDWNGFVSALNDHLFDYRAEALTLAQKSKSISPMAREMKVDIEVYTHAFAERVAVFLSPSCIFSEGYGRSFDEQVPRIFMSALFYDRTVFASAVDEELDRVETLRELTRRPHGPLGASAATGGIDAADRIETFDLRSAFNPTKEIGARKPEPAPSKRRRKASQRDR